MARRIWVRLLLVLLFSAPLLPGEPNSAKSTQRTPRFHTNLDTVIVRATVTDRHDRSMGGLEREHFKVFDNKIEQTLSHFSGESAPVSVGILFDRSRSMSGKLGEAKESVARFLRGAGSDDEYFLVTFNHEAALAQDFTSAAYQIRDKLSLVQSEGRTALYDALYLGLQRMSEARNSRRALIVITDGEDNSSRYTFSEIKDFARESDVQVYAIAQQGVLGYGQPLISEVVSLTGGRVFFPRNFESLDYYCDLIHSELRSQYLLGFSPTSTASDGRWHKLRVSVAPPPGLPKATVRTREGYFAPKK